eukprot:1539954-Alexandrium_andersonii.AAC.1
MLRGAQGAIRNPPKARQCFNLPQSSIRRAQERPQNWSPKLPMGAFCATSRADSEYANEGGS